MYMYVYIYIYIYMCLGSISTQYRGECPVGFVLASCVINKIYGLLFELPPPSTSA